MSASDAALTIDMGGIDYGWQLALFEPGKVRSVRSMTQYEVDEVSASLNAIREHTDRTAASLLLGAHDRVMDVLATMRPGNPQTMANPKARLNEIAVPLVSWLLVWAMFLDHALHDLSDKYPDSDRLELLRAATHDAFDRHPGYRMAEGLRDYVSHRGMPPLKIEGTVRRGAGDVRVESVMVTIEPQRLLEDAKLNRHVRTDIDDGTAILELSRMVGDAMVGMHDVMTRYAQLLEDHLVPHLERIVELLGETAPNLPIIINMADGLRNLQWMPVDDVLPYLVARGYVRDGGAGTMKAASEGSGADRAQ